MDNPSILLKMVNIRGRVMIIHGWEAQNLRSQGAKMVSWDTKEEYLPDYDQFLNPKASELREVSEDLAGNTLECEEI